MDDVEPEEGGQGLAAKMAPLVDGVGEAVEEEVEHVRKHGLAAFPPCQLRHAAVGVGMVAEQDFADDADPGAVGRAHGNGAEVPHQVLHVLRRVAPPACREVRMEPAVPGFEQGLGVALACLVGCRVAGEALEHVAVDDGEEEVVEELPVDDEARLVGA